MNRARLVIAVLTASCSETELLATERVCVLDADTSLDAAPNKRRDAAPSEDGRVLTAADAESIELDAGPAEHDAGPQEWTELIEYALFDNEVDETATIRWIGATGTGILSVDWNGGTHEVSIDTTTPGQGVAGNPPTGYRSPRNLPPLATVVAHALLYACGKWDVPWGFQIAFVLATGESFVAQYAVHHDGPDGPRPYDHPGISVFEAN